MLHRQPAIEKVTAQIGWQPTRTLDEILADVVASTQRRADGLGGVRRSVPAQRSAGKRIDVADRVACR